MFDFSKYLQWVKLAPKYLLALVIASSVLIFSPKELLQKVGLMSIRQDYLPWIGLILLIAGSLLLSHGFGAGWSWFSQRWTWRKNLKQMQRNLHNLSSDEIEILKKYICTETKTQYFEISNGTIGGLVTSKILYRSSNLGYGTTMAYNIQPWAWEYLLANAGLLGLDSISQKGVQKLK